jgi:hypothetical protein
MSKTETDAVKESQAKTTENTMLRWVLGGVAAGIVGIGFFAQFAFNTFMTRDEAQTNFLRQDLKSAIGESISVQERLVTAIEGAKSRDDAIVRAVENNTNAVTILRTEVSGLRDDTRQGVWRAVEAPKSVPPR